MTSAKLLAVVEVSREDRVRCQASGCNHGVFRRIHVVLESEKISVYGSECFKKLFAGTAISWSLPYYTSSEGRCLTEEERQLLIENTARLVQQFEAERQTQLERETGLKPSPAPVTPVLPPLPRSPVTGSAAQQAAEEQAKQLLRKQYGINPELPGWYGLVQSEAKRILRLGN